MLEPACIRTYQVYMSQQQRKNILYYSAFFSNTSASFLCLCGQAGVFRSRSFMFYSDHTVASGHSSTQNLTRVSFTLQLRKQLLRRISRSVDIIIVLTWKGHQGHLVHVLRPYIVSSCEGEAAIRGEALTPTFIYICSPFIEHHVRQSNSAPQRG